ncbi:hypothetical protein K469DRAFT_573671 [Zopfia rhizophila CBS 207.26]|uniref:Rhodopsin domain-containing protein n=1 Tax=Zopfia rhizophila CBS 207.26 TaxID=1314779 RepID=A0A6A6E5G3_9PEZI|nr:hypothetical protein K469DRAFT_573671 [Zopfia rhizophila CBS 207.26]
MNVIIRNVGPQAGMEAILNQPVGHPPEGVTPNLVHPPNKATLAYSVVITSFFSVTIFTWIRILVKWYIVRKLHLEDYLLPFAWAATIGHLVPAFIVYDFAPIIHTWDLTMRDFSKLLLYFRIAAIFYNISVLLIKLAMLIQVFRIFVPRGSRSKTFWVVQTLIYTNIFFYVSCIFTQIFTCHPIQKAWKPWIREGSCLNFQATAMATAVFNLVSDLSILFLTQKVILEIQLTKKERIRLTVVFCAGLIPCAFSSLCLYYNKLEMHSTDIVYDSSLMGLACYAEIASGMFVLFLPVLPKFFSFIKENPMFPSPRHGSRTEIMETTDKRGRSWNHISYSEAGTRVEIEKVETKKGELGMHTRSGSGGDCG